jgi:hypothetical protein
MLTSARDDDPKVFLMLDSECSMEDAEIDSLLGTLQFGLAEPLAKLLAIGEPALVRLFKKMSLQIRIPDIENATNVREALDNGIRALSALASKWPETTISLLQDPQARLSAGLILALHMSTDRRLQQFATDAFKAGNF